MRISIIHFITSINNWKITFASAAQKSEFSYLLQNENIQEANIQVNDSGFDQWISELNPDVVLFDRFIMEEQFGWRVAEYCKNAIRILDTEDLHFLRHARHQAIKDEFIPGKIDLQNDHAKREIASILRCDVSLIISSYEFELLESNKRDFKAEAKSVTHMLTHLPKNPFCSVCQRAKLENAKSYKHGGVSAHKYESFGDHVTGDTIVLHGLKDRGVGNKDNAVVMFDFGTGWTSCHPVNSRSEEDTVFAFS